MDDQNKNLILATVLSFLVILVWFVFFPPEDAPVDPNAPAAITATTTQAVTPPAAAQATVDATAVPEKAEAPRLLIDTPRLKGSISLLGGRIDDLSLKTYTQTIDPKSAIVTLLSPVGEPHPYYALYGWTPAGALGFEDVPGANTLWSQIGSNDLSPETPITLQWEKLVAEVMLNHSNENITVLANVARR